MVTYVLMVSETFPATHSKRGTPTNFSDAIGDSVKIHTLRSNYALWDKRFKKINAGQAQLSLRVWEGKPYASKHREVCKLDRTVGIGLERLQYSLLLKEGAGFFVLNSKNDSYKALPVSVLAKNDGLSEADFREWLDRYDLTVPLAVIHFTDFRYNAFK
jgi:hypothetical protein